jgi:glycosyltransferase involved in cell wall biosynthesis
MWGNIMPTQSPRITIGIVSYNRFFYLRALISSLSRAIDRTIPTEIIIVDNGSKEKELVDFIENKDSFLNTCPIANNIRVIHHSPKDWMTAEYEGRNVILEESMGDYIMFLQDDQQAIIDGLFMKDMINITNNHSSTMIIVDAIRRKDTQIRYTNPIRIVGTECDFFKTSYRRFPTTGFASRAIYERCDLYPVNKADYWGWAEDIYNSRVVTNFPSRSAFVTQVPQFLPIWNGRQGEYSFIRNGKRYGDYIGPSGHMHLYYDFLTKEDIRRLRGHSRISSFVDIAKPMAWDYRIDSSGDVISTSQDRIMEEATHANIIN